jgi:hypothetical protein
MRVDVNGLKPGCEVTLQGQRFQCLSVVDVDRKDGSPARLLVWEGQCATPRCPLPVLFATSSSGEVWFNRRCQKHRAPGVPAFPRKKIRSPDF